MEEQVATAVGRSEQQFKFLAMETAARRRREVCTKRNSAESSGELPQGAAVFTLHLLGKTTPLAPWARKRSFCS